MLSSCMKCKMNALCFLKFMENDLLKMKSKKFHVTLANLVNIFEVLNVLNLVFQRKNTNCVDDCDAINAFVENWGCGTVEFKKAIFILEEAETLWQFLKQEFEGYFSDLATLNY